MYAYVHETGGGFFDGVCTPGNPTANFRDPPPPISAEHATLRKEIIEECRAIEWDHEARDWRDLPLCTPESAYHALKALELMFEEQALLTEHDVDWRLYNTYKLD
jgi:hypothetical protein